MKRLFIFVFIAFLVSSSLYSSVVLRKTYHSNGKVKLLIKGFFENGARYIKRFKYYDNGKKKYKKIYRNNKKHGLWEYYDKEGQVRRTKEYDNGVLIR